MYKFSVCECVDRGYVIKTFMQWNNVSDQFLLHKCLTMNRRTNNEYPHAFMEK